MVIHCRAGSLSLRHLSYFAQSYVVPNVFLLVLLTYGVAVFLVRELRQQGSFLNFLVDNHLLQVQQAYFVIKELSELLDLLEVLLEQVLAFLLSSPSPQPELLVFDLVVK